MKNILILFISLTLFGCGKSEIDKCVEAKFKQKLQMDCPVTECNKRYEENVHNLFEADFREQCLRASAGK
jgi:hypothetical protein